MRRLGIVVVGLAVAVGIAASLGCTSESGADQPSPVPTLRNWTHLYVMSREELEALPDSALVQALLDCEQSLAGWWEELEARDAGFWGLPQPGLFDRDAWDKADRKLILHTLSLCNSAVNMASHCSQTLADYEQEQNR